MPRLACAVALLSLMLGAAACELWDPPKGEIGLRITEGGRLTQGCLVNVYTSEGQQIQRVATNQVGVAYVKRLNPGTYTFKFTGMGDQPFPAVRTVTINAGSSSFLAVELNQEKDPKGEAEASRAGGKDYGENDLTP